MCKNTHRYFDVNFLKKHLKVKQKEYLLTMLAPLNIEMIVANISRMLDPPFEEYKYLNYEYFLDTLIQNQPNIVKI